MRPVLLAALSSQSASTAMLVRDFESKPYHAPYAPWSTTAATPATREAAMALLHEATSAKAVVGFLRSGKGAFSNVSAQWAMRLDEAGRGLAFVLLPTATYGSEGAPPADVDWGKGRKRVAVESGTYGQGWRVSVEFRFHKGLAER